MGFENVVAGPITERDLNRLREAVCIQTEKIYDSCREKDCIEDAPVIFKCPERIAPLLNAAVNVKVNRAEIVDVFADVEPVPFKKGFYTIDLKFFIKVHLVFFVPGMGGGLRTIPVCGLILFDKKVILFGSEGGIKIWKSKYKEHGVDCQVQTHLEQDNLPYSKVEVAEPVALTARIADIRDKKCHIVCCDNIPGSVSARFEDEELDLNGVDIAEAERGGTNGPVLPINRKQVLVSVGLFVIVKLVRLVQLLIPAFSFCVPNKTCIASTEDNPCELFDTIDFPVDEFFPPQIQDFPGAVEEAEDMCNHHHKKHDAD